MLLALLSLPFLCVLLVSSEAIVQFILTQSVPVLLFSFYFFTFDLRSFIHRHSISLLSGFYRSSISLLSAFYQHTMSVPVSEVLCFVILFPIKFLFIT